MKRTNDGPAARWIVTAVAVLLAIVPVLTVLPAGTALAQPVAGTVGDGTPESCTWSALDQALEDFDDITFDCGPDPHTISIGSDDLYLEVCDRKVVDGGGLITLDADRKWHHFRVYYPYGHLLVEGLTFTGGWGVFGGAIENQMATLEVIDVTFYDNLGTEGGAIYTHASGKTTVVDSTFIENNALAPNSTTTTFENGGAIFIGIDAELYVYNSTFTDNYADREGGAIRSGSNTIVEIEDSTFDGNSAVRDGGTIFSYQNTQLTIRNSEFTGNSTGRHGGAIFAQTNSTVDVENSSFTDNESGNIGGGIYSGATLNVRHSTFSGNRGVVDAGAIWNHGTGTATIEDTTFHGNTITNNSGGAIFNQTNGTLQVRRSAFIENSARNGGAIYSNQNGATTHIENSTFSGNAARDRGAAVVNAGGQVTIASSTLVDNVAGIAGAISVRRDTAVTTVTQTIIMTGGLSTNCEVENAARIVSGGYNIFDDTSCPDIGPTDVEDATASDVDLMGLGNYGGPTLSYVPDNDSITIDKVPTDLCLDVDQRGFTRPAGEPCDIGAVDTGASNPSLPVALPGSAETNEDTPLNVTLSGTHSGDGSMSFDITTEPSHGTLGNFSVVTCDGGDPNTCSQSATWTPDPDFFGTDTFSFTVSDGEATSEPAAFTIEVLAVNDPPAFTPGADQTVAQDAEAQIVDDWATTISAGPANESDQTVQFIILDNDNPALFSAGPQVSPEGTLTFTPAAGASGQAMVTLVLEDDGGTTNGGTNRSADHQLTITVQQAPEPPVIESVTNDGPVFEGSPAQITVNLESGADVSYAFDCDNYGTYEVNPQPGNTTTCTFPDQGDYPVNARVSNADGTATVNTTVTVINADPQIGNIETQVNGSQVTVTVSASDPGLNDVLSYRFDCDNDTIFETDSGTTNTATCDIGNAGGTLTINVEVTDGDGGSATGFDTVQVGPVIPQTTLCAERFTGLVYYPTNGTCGSKGISLDFPVAGKTHFCALILIGTLRVTPSGFCLPFVETRYTLPNAGPLTVCIHEQSGLVRLVNERHSCLRIETRRVIG